MMDLIIVGSGISGMSAAIQAAEMGAHVELLSNFEPERSQSVMAAGGINAALDVFGQGDSAACHAEDTLRGGCYLENEAVIRDFCEKAPENLRWLEQMGAAFSRDERHALRLRAFGGQTFRRTVYAGAATGKQIVTALVRKCREYEVKGLIHRTTGLYFHSALIREGICHGVLMADALTGEIRAFYGAAVIFAVGGQNKLFGKTTGSEICDGYAAGRLFSQGVTLRNLEFIQYHPTTIETSHKRMLITEAARGEGGRLFCMKGDERCYFMEELFGAKGNLMSRDIVSKCMYDCPSQVYLDISFLGAELIHARLQEVYELCRDYIGLDVTKEPIPVAPAVHFFMGGIAVDRDHETNVHCLYAVGECASKYHGANRLGGNSLLAAVHSGRTAAAHAYGKSDRTECDVQSYFESCIEAAQQELRQIKASQSLYPAAYVQKDIAAVMNQDLGITRDEESLMSGVRNMDMLIGIIGKLKCDPSVSIYENYRLPYMALLAKAILLSAAARRETRGAHIRTDYPDTLDAFRKCSFAKYADGEIQISFKEDADDEDQD